MNGREEPLILFQWRELSDLPLDGPVFLWDGAELPPALQQCTIALKAGTESRARELLDLGAGRVLLADAVLMDSSLMERLVQQYGSERVGIWMPVRRMSVTWTLDRTSNEDFSCLTPSLGKASWEILKADGTATGTDVEWWTAQMLESGACMALVAVDMQDDGDLDICANLIERFDEHIWFSPRLQPDADLLPWVRYGQVRKLVLPAVNSRGDDAMALLYAAAAPSPVPQRETA